MENIKNVNKILLIILIIEILIGGSGKIFNIPIRIGILGIALILTIINILKYKYKIPKNLLLSISCLWVYSIMWVVIGILKGNNFKYALEDITNFFCIIYIVIILIFTEYKKNNFIKIINILKVCMIILSIITIALFIGSYIGNYIGINVGGELEKFNNATNYGVITGGIYGMKFARVYFINGIFMQVALPFFIYDILNKNRLKDYIFTIIILLGIFSSSTRGYWLGAVVVLFLMILLNKKEKRIKIIKLIFITVIICSPIFTTDFFKIQVLGRITSITNFSTDASNDIRRIQINYMGEEIKENPILGSGFGSNLNKYTEATGLDGRRFEVYYLELVYKTGILGFLILVIILLLSIYRIFKDVILNDSIIEENKEIMIGLVSGSISVLITGITNPYMQGSIGIFIISIMFSGYIILVNDKKIDINKEIIN
ncbi:O-antigen ligase family protein [Clostridium thermobutyricum]|uniref:O-antigen ligase family protein n=1 Tax=Clostridium thermobutyricum TaxID=29372 RepID=UPI003F51ED05